jgi:hypothetical protein
MSTTIPIDRADLQACLTKLAAFVLHEEANDRSAIAVRLAVGALNFQSEEAHAMWQQALEDVETRRRTTGPQIQALREELAGRSLVDDQPSNF